jgi:hypothetical protein
LASLRSRPARELDGSFWRQAGECRRSDRVPSHQDNQVFLPHRHAGCPATIRASPYGWTVPKIPIMMNAVQPARPGCFDESAP